MTEVLCVFLLFLFSLILCCIALGGMGLFIEASFYNNESLEVKTENTAEDLIHECISVLAYICKQ